MISRQETLDLSREFGLDPNVVEKDYVLGWLLAGIFNHPALRAAWVFKGGTCLKKCYFETYRFSEDLDFTVTDPSHLKRDFLAPVFTEVGRWVYENSGIELPANTQSFDVYENPRGQVSVQGRVGYRGPMQRGGDPARVKLDLTDDEVLVLEPVRREVYHPYSDRTAEGFSALCYSFEEVFAEKLRALAERERPRDLYDVIHLYRHSEVRPDRGLLRSTLEKKCAFKGIAVPTVASLENRPERAELESEWANMLGHQLPQLPPFEQFWLEIPEVLSWVQGTAEKPVLVSAAVREDIDRSWQPPPMIHAWHARVPFEVIRFAAANRICVDLRHQGSSRLIEPYSLRRTKDGALLLFAVKHLTGELRAYRMDRIEGAAATRVPFVPRFLVELTPAGEVSVPPMARRADPKPVQRRIQNARRRRRR